MRRHDLAPDPFEQFRRWYDDADPDTRSALTVATATSDGRPSARVVLLRGADQRGFTFFTNLHSRKGEEVAVNPVAALLFHWGERQIRVEGEVVATSEDESDAYWANRPLPSRLAAVASAQSQPVSGRDELERLVAEARDEHGADPPRPSWWGGLRVRPTVFEFWQHGADRLHDRFRYRPGEDGAWRIERLAP